MAFSAIAAGLLIVTASVIIAYSAAANKRARRLPPGPPGKPFLGNAHQIPRESSWLYYAELKEKYGDVIHLSVLGKPILVLGSYQAVNDLLQQRGHLYSDRPRLPFVGEMMGWVKALSSLPYSQEWRIHRQLFARHMSTSGVRSYYPTIEKESRLCAERVLLNPARFVEDTRLAATRLIVKSTYGFDVETAGDEFLKLAEEIVSRITAAFAPGSNFVDIFPPLKYAPYWLPVVGGPNRHATETNALLKMLIETPFDRVKAGMMGDSLAPSFTSHAIDQLQAGKITITEADIKWISGTMYVAGVDTVLSTLQCYYLAMTLYPDVQRKAQEEIDQIVGSDRLPCFDDMGKLPYVECLIKEVYRFHPIAPLGVPHQLIEDDEYRGYLMPKGAVVIANSWAMSRDETIYPNPESFIPERFMKTDGTPEAMDPRKFIFGHGKRICAGMYFAEAGVFMQIVTSLATMSISKVLDADGNEITPNLAFAGALASAPLPFQCNIRPRSAYALALLQTANHE